MVAWKDQMEEYVMVTESLPDASDCHQRKRSSILPCGLCLDSEVQHQELSLAHTDWDRGGAAAQRRASLLEQQLPDIDLENTEAAAHSAIDGLNAFADAGCGYVDIGRHVDEPSADYSRVKEANSDNIILLEKEDQALEEAQIPEAASEDYSRVKEVDNGLFLQRQVDTSCREKGKQADCCLQKSPPQRGVCTALIDSGYVDSLPAPPLM